MLKINHLCFPLSLLVFLIAACSPSNPTPSQISHLSAWIDAPLDGSTLSMEPYEIVAHGSDPGAIVALELSINNEILITYPNPSPDNLLVSVRETWSPPHPGEYLIEARSQNSSSVWSKPASVNIQVVAPDPIEILPADPTKVAVEIIPTATIEFSQTNCNPTIQAKINTTCRSGPTTYNIPVAYLLEGDIADINGKNIDATWWSVNLPDLDSSCWISDQTVSIECIPDNLPVLPAPPYITRITKSTPQIYWGDNPVKTVTVSAQIGGEIAISSARLIFSLLGKNNWQGVTMIQQSEFIWEGTINARNIDGYININSSKLEYYIFATNEEEISTQSEILTDIKLKEVP